MYLFCNPCQINKVWILDATLIISPNILQESVTVDASEVGGQSSIEGTDTAADDDIDDEDLVVTNTPLMLGLCEAMCVLWTFSEEQLEKVT